MDHTIIPPGDSQGTYLKSARTLLRSRLKRRTVDFTTRSNTEIHHPDQPEPTNMTFDEFFNAVSSVPGGMILMAMPRDADLSTLRFVANTLLPMAKEAIVDDEMFFLYGRFDDFNIEAWMELSDYQRRVVGLAIGQYASALYAFLSTYKCRFYRLWEASRSLVTDISSSGYQT